MKKTIEVELTGTITVEHVRHELEKAERAMSASPHDAPFLVLIDASAADGLCLHSPIPALLLRQVAGL